MPSDGGGPATPDRILPRELAELAMLAACLPGPSTHANLRSAASEVLDFHAATLEHTLPTLASLATQGWVLASCAGEGQPRWALTRAGYDRVAYLAGAAACEVPVTGHGRAALMVLLECLGDLSPTVRRDVAERLSRTIREAQVSLVQAAVSSRSAARRVALEREVAALDAVSGVVEPAAA